MSGPRRPDTLLATLDETLDLIARTTGALPPAGTEVAPLPSLLEECEAHLATPEETAPLRSLHHFAATGGTLMSKCLALMPNVTLLSEMDPLSRMGLPRPSRPRPLFWPTDPIYAGRVALRPIPDATATAAFQGAVSAMQTHISGAGGHLVLRDHAHSQFCTDTDPASRPTLLAMLQDLGPVRAAVTVRHPIDSFLSLQTHNWVSFAPDTLGEYARRYMLFLDTHADLPVVRYEDFVADPEAVLATLCGHLDLPFRPGFEALLDAVRMTGDSGRSSPRIAPRSRRAVPDPLRRAAAASEPYQALCVRLSYDPDPGTDPAAISE